MFSFTDLNILILVMGIILFFYTLTSCRFNVSGEKKINQAQYGIDYIIITVKNYFIPPPPSILLQTKQEYEEYKESLIKEGLRHRKEGANSPLLPANDKYKFL